MSKKVVAVIPEDVRVSTSTPHSQVILVVETNLFDGSQSELRFLLNLDQADALSLDIQRQSQRLRDALAHEVPPDTVS